MRLLLSRSERAGSRLRRSGDMLVAQQKRETLGGLTGCPLSASGRWVGVGLGKMTRINRQAGYYGRLRTFGLALGLLVFSGCYSWRPSPPGPLNVVAYEEHRQVRVTTVDSTIVVLQNPRLAGDSLMGFPDPECRSSVAAGGQLVCSRPEADAGVALGEIASLETRVRDVGRSTLLGLVAVAGIGWLVYAAISPSIERDCYILCS